MFRIASSLIAVALVTTDAPADHNPLFPGADPDMIAACGAWWIFPTSQGTTSRREFTSRFFAWRSSDMRHWDRAPAPVLDIRSIRWIGDDDAADHFLWAPSVIPKQGRYYLYYSVGPQNPTPSRLGVAVADRPEGPYADSGRPLLTGGKGFEAIDPMVFTDPRSGNTYLYAGGSAGSKLRVFKMNPDMVSIRREVPVANPPLFTEGAFMHERRGIYYLSYSHGRFNDATYSVHYATSRSPTGPFTYRGAILASDRAHQGPGHHSFVAAPGSGQWFIAYHRWDREDASGPFTGMRNVAIDRIRYDRNGLIARVTMTDDSVPATPAPREVCPQGATPGSRPAGR